MCTSRRPEGKSSTRTSKRKAPTQKIEKQAPARKPEITSKKKSQTPRQQCQRRQAFCTASESFKKMTKAEWNAPMTIKINGKVHGYDENDDSDYEYESESDDDSDYEYKSSSDEDVAASTGGGVDHSSRNRMVTHR